MYLAPPGSRFCEYGQSVSKPECENAGKNFFPNPPRNLQLGSGCKGGWINVPLGCSVEAKGDGSAHYKTTEDANCTIGNSANHYQLVCRNDGKSHFIPSLARDLMLKKILKWW